MYPQSDFWSAYFVKPATPYFSYWVLVAQLGVFWILEANASSMNFSVFIEFVSIENNVFPGP
jgi:hypothetical protein